MAQDTENKNGKAYKTEYSDAKKDIREKALGSLKKLSGLVDVDEIDRELERQSEEKQKAAEGGSEDGHSGS